MNSSVTAVVCVHIAASDVAADEVILGVFKVILGKRLNPFLCASSTLIPVVKRMVLEVTQGFVCFHCEGRTRHSQGVTVQQRRVVIHGAQDPAENVIKNSQEPEHQ